SERTVSPPIPESKNPMVFVCSKTDCLLVRYRGDGFLFYYIGKGRKKQEAREKPTRKDGFA
ncbi:MAG: hypothetical protein II650_08965, partial [Clostridia bacterium]|nr:hypothetical protein [Clostridia bacterium]